jgi:polar amino acid transport system substrate-binding protein
MQSFRTAALFALIALASATVARADALDDIKARGKLLVGVEAGGTGAILSQDPSGKDVGLDADINAAIAEQMGVKLEMVDVAWAGILPALLAKRFDMILSGMTATKERAEKVNFSTPYGDSSYVVVVRNDADIHGPDDLSGKVIGVQVSSPAVPFLNARDEELAAANRPKIKEIKVYDDIPTLFVDLAAKRIDGVLMPYPIVLGFMAKRPGEFRVGVEFKDRSYFSAAIRKGDTALLAEVNRILMKMKSDGSLAKLQAKWLGGATPNLPDSWQ